MKNIPDESTEDAVKISDENEKSWAEEAKQDMEDFIESQGIYIRQ